MLASPAPPANLNHSRRFKSDAIMTRSFSILGLFSLFGPMIGKWSGPPGPRERTGRVVQFGARGDRWTVDTVDRKTHSSELRGRSNSASLATSIVAVLRMFSSSLRVDRALARRVRLGSPFGDAGRVGRT